MVRKYKKNKGTEPEDDEPGDINLVNESNEMDIDHDEELEKKDLPKTRAKKELFLKLYPKCHLIAAATCREVGIAQKTFYGWLNDDPIFSDAIEKAKIDINKIVVDILMHKVTVEKETRAITYFLDRKHPEFKPTSKTEVVTGSKTLEDILKSDEEKENANNNIEAGVRNEGKPNSPGSEVSAGAPVENKEQAGEVAAVPFEQNPGVLLEKKDETQPDSKSAPEGNIENNRRRPIDRLRTKRN